MEGTGRSALLLRFARHNLILFILGCNKDYVALYSPTPGTEKKIYCGGNTWEATFNSNQVLVEFRTDDDISLEGFNINYIVERSYGPANLGLFIHI